MYSNILVPTDGSQLSDRAVKEAAHLAQAFGASITLLHVVPAYRMPVSTIEGPRLKEVLTPALHKRRMRAHARKVLDAAQSKANGAAKRRAVVFSDQPYEAIVDTARRRRSDLIVMASHGWRGLKGLLLGSETHKVLTHSRVPVLVVR